MLANAFGAANLLLNQEGVRAAFPALRGWMVLALLLLSAASIVACLALWRWKRWGFLVLGCAYLAMLAINVGFSAPLAHTALGPLGLVVLAAVAWPVRREFGARPTA